MILTTDGNSLTTSYYALYSYGLTNSDTLLVRSGATIYAGGLAVDAGTVKLPGKPCMRSGVATS